QMQKLVEPFLQVTVNPGTTISLCSATNSGERFGSDSEVLGKTVRLDGVIRTVIGVMPSGFEFPGVMVWMPLTIRIDQHNSFTRPAVGRLKTDFSAQQAQ